MLLNELFSSLIIHLLMNLFYFFLFWLLSYFFPVIFGMIHRVSLILPLVSSCWLCVRLDYMITFVRTEGYSPSEATGHCLIGCFVSFPCRFIYQEHTASSESYGLVSLLSGFFFGISRENCNSIYMYMDKMVQESTWAMPTALPQCCVMWLLIH